MFSAKIFCAEIPQDFFEFALPNGMSVFVFEDFSTPLVHAELCARAGYEIRNESDAPYFFLCSEIVSEGEDHSEKDEAFFSALEAECAADGARFSIDCTGAELKDVFGRMGERAFAPNFCDETLQEKFQKVKGQAISSTEDFINSHINSRVFENVSRQGRGAPYPPFSEQDNLSELRTIVHQVFQEYYAPQNCAIFVSGALNAKAVFCLALETFGKYSRSPHAAEMSFFIEKKNSAFGASDDEETDDLQARKKIVLCDKDFSPDFAQVVATISPLEKIKAQIAAAIFEVKDSALKNSLVKSGALAIRGSDYVNAAAATKRNLSRVVLQTLLEKSELSAFGQIEMFEEILRESFCNFSEAEFEAAKQNLVQDFYDSTSNPKLFMEKFARFWTNPKETTSREKLIEQFISIPEKIMLENFAELKSALQKNETRIFVLLNEKILSPLRNEFEKSGYEIVEQKEFSEHEKIAENAAPFSERDNSLCEAIPLYSAEFVSRSRAATKTFSLSNKIRVTLKENPSSQKTAIALYVFGGEAFDAETNCGMQSVLADILERSISDSLKQKYSRGEIVRPAQAAVSVLDTEFFITAECESSETKAVLQCIGDALLCNDFAPSQVDVALNARRTRHILRAGSLSRQMYCAGVRQFYESPAYCSLYSPRKEILENLKYSDALESYQALLDASRIEILAAGNFKETSEAEFVSECEKIFGGLKASKATRNILSEPNDVSKQSLAVKLEHTFLTDIGSDKAGPRPSVLVPTTDFSDPVQFWICSPKMFEEDFSIFDALLLELEAQCKRTVSHDERFKGIAVRLEEQSALVSFGAITFFNVRKISDADFILQNSLERMRERLFADSARSPKGEDAGGDVLTDFSEKEFFDRMKSRWIKSRCGKCSENGETISRLAREASAARLSGNSQFQIQDALAREYENVALCESETFREIWQNYFEKPPFKLYSLDSKK